MASLTANLHVRLPWWWRPYMWALVIAARCGIAIDIEKHAARIVRGIRYEVR